MNKHEIRQHICHQREMLSLDEQQLAAKKACEHILKNNRFRLSKHIAFYLATRGELDPAPILQAAHQAGKHCYLPVLHPHKENSLCFMPYQPGDELVKNRFNILEPVFKTDHFPAWHLDVVLMPLVAFDRLGHRIGMGKGYYDRTFNFLNPTQETQPYLLGLAYQFQEIPLFTPEAHDVPLNNILTEHGIV